MRSLVCSFIFVSALLFCQCACFRKTYTIKGTLPDDAHNGNKVLLIEEGFQYNIGYKRLDTAIVRNRRFVFKGPAGAEPSLGLVFVRGTSPYSVKFIFEPGKIMVDFKGKYNSVVTGTPLNDEYYREITVPNEMYLRASLVDSMKNIDHLLEDAVIKKVNYIEKYFDYPQIVSYLIRGFCYSRNYVVDHMISRLPELYQTNLKAEIAAWERRKEELMATYTPPPERDLPDSVSVGRKFTDLALKNTAGDTVLLSELIKENKITVLDFWASWCGPCLEEMPFMKSLYEEFGPQGMGLVGISTDKGEAAWKKALAKHDMPWLQTISPQAGKIYYVLAIPTIILIDRDGTIVARRLRREQLKNKIKELLQE